MPFSQIIALVIDDPSDVNTVSRAADLIRENRGRLLLTYVIRVERSLPLDAEIKDQVARGEQVLQRSERLAQLPRSDIESQLLQSREIGPAIVHESIVRDVDAIVIGTSYVADYGLFSLGDHIPYILEHAACDVILWREHINEYGAVSQSSKNGRSDRAV